MLFKKLKTASYFYLRVDTTQGQGVSQKLDGHMHRFLQAYTSVQPQVEVRVVVLLPLHVFVSVYCMAQHDCLGISTR